MKKEIMFISILLLITMVVLICTACSNEKTDTHKELIDYEEPKTTETDLLLAFIDGKPYYYDPIYLFKLTNSVFPEEPTIIEKKTTFLMELAILEIRGTGLEISDSFVEDETLRRSEEHKITIEMEQEQQDSSEIDNITEEQLERYQILQKKCAGKYGNEKEYLKHMGLYIEKYYYFKYSSQKMLEFREMQKSSGDFSNYDDRYLEFLRSDFDELVKKYHVEIVDDTLL
ncbi:MAG TPA: hypothetical protein PKD52_10120 [Clostridiales bacterium]|nr:hypothetical protein [Clostridiales bacterium]